MGRKRPAPDTTSVIPNAFYLSYSSLHNYVLHASLSVGYVRHQSDVSALLGSVVVSLLDSLDSETPLNLKFNAGESFYTH